jgi:hypothetical protein
MLKEQFFSLAMKLYARAFDAKERITKSLKNHDVADYLHGLSHIATIFWEKQRQKRSEQKIRIVPSRRTKSSMGDKKDQWPEKNAIETKKVRKSSIKPAKEIGSLRADVILQKLTDDNLRRVSINDAIDGKKSLAYLIWALGHAEEAKVVDGISIHDVSALLYRACQIELYPINVSRVVYKNPALIRKVGQEKRTKTYLLTDEGQSLFREKFL